jgi:Tol biopolymer transport system component
MSLKTFLGSIIISASIVLAVIVGLLLYRDLGAPDAPLPESSIAFLCQTNRLCLAPLDGSGNRSLIDVQANGIAGDPTWSPDGKWIAFTLLVPAGGGELHVVNAAGEPVIKRLTFNHSDVRSIAWSPDSRRIAFTTHIEVERLDAAFIIDADGSNLKQIASRSTGPIWWSADGTSIAYVVNRPHEIGLIDVANPGAPKIHDFGLSARPVYAAPDLSYFIFTNAATTCGSKESFALFRAEMKTGELTTLTPETNTGGCVSVSHSGKSVAFGTLREPGGDNYIDIYVMAIDGSSRQIISNEGRTFQSYAWSPDDSMLAFTSFKGLEVVKIEDLDVKRLSFDPGDMNPAWSPK